MKNLIILSLSAMLATPAMAVFVEHDFDAFPDGALDQTPPAGEIGWNDGSTGTAGALDIIADPTGSGRGQVVRMTATTAGQEFGRTGNGGAGNVNRNAEGELWFGFDMYVADQTGFDSGFVWRLALKRGTGADVVLLDGFWNSIRIRSPLKNVNHILSEGWHQIRIKNDYDATNIVELFVDGSLLEVSTATNGQAENAGAKAQRLYLERQDRGGNFAGFALFDNIWGGNEIPEPATLVLLGLGTLFLTRRKA